MTITHTELIWDQLQHKEGGLKVSSGTAWEIQQRKKKFDSLKSEGSSTSPPDIVMWDCVCITVHSWSSILLIFCVNIYDLWSFYWQFYMAFACRRLLTTSRGADSPFYIIMEIWSQQSFLQLLETVGVLWYGVKGQEDYPWRDLW